jgi:predicted DNA-binding transcriptional regulator AlpA
MAGTQDELLTPEEVADWIRRPITTLYNWRSRRVGPPAIRVGGRLRYRRADLEAWLEANTSRGDAA